MPESIRNNIISSTLTARFSTNYSGAWTAFSVPRCAAIGLDIEVVHLAFKWKEIAAREFYRTEQR